MIRLALPVLFVLLAAGCQSEALLDDVDGGTWETIQTQILAPNCANACHIAGSTYADQSGLVLTADVAYGQLADVPPLNPAARADGLLRVHRSAETDLHRSFLWEKINAPGAEHLLADHPSFGNIMPLGGEALSYGELAFIRQWLLSGAPEHGIVADEHLLADTTRFRANSFTALPMLAPGAGVSIRVGPFEVAPDFEREFFYHEPQVTADELLIDRIEIAMRPGSHHFIAYTFSEGMPDSQRPTPNVIRDLRHPDGSLNVDVLRQMGWHQFFSGTQWPRMDYRFPAGVALRLPAGSAFDLNPHYVNRTDAPRQGEVHLNMHAVPAGQVAHVADVLNFNNFNINLPPRKVTTLEKVFTVSSRSHVFQLFSHAHEHMIEFRVEKVGGVGDGQTIYLATDYEHPPILDIDPPLVLEPGEGFRLITTYNNWTDRTLTFGLESTDEMMILFGYYYTD